MPSPTCYFYKLHSRIYSLRKINAFLIREPNAKLPKLSGTIHKCAEFRRIVTHVILGELGCISSQMVDFIKKLVLIERRYRLSPPILVVE